MTLADRRPHNVIYDPDLLAMKSKEEHRALLNAVRKLGELGEQLGPPHTKPLKGDRTATLRELRPRQGRSDWRAICLPASSAARAVVEPDLGDRLL